jgi:hypothetical protein
MTRRSTGAWREGRGEIHIEPVVTFLSWEGKIEWDLLDIEEHVRIKLTSRFSSESLLGAREMSAVRAAFYLSAHTLPVGLQSIVTLQYHLEAKPLGRISNLLPSKRMNPPFNLLVGNRGLELFNTQKVLIIERAEPIDRSLKFGDDSLEVRRIHKSSPSR